MNSNDFLKTIIDFTISVHDVTDEIRNAVKPETITPQQYRILEMIFLNQISSVSEVCTCLGISMPNASREIKKLSTLGYIKKIPHATDGRRSMISLTEIGALTMEKAFDKVKDIFQEKLVDIPLREQEELMKSMHILVEKLFNSPK